MQLDQLDPKILGLRLADARKGRGITQDQAARHIGCSRPTLIAIEKGKRSPKAEEIVALAELYSKTVNEIVRPGEPLAELQPALRAVAHNMKADDTETVHAISALQKFAEDYHRLEELAGVKLRINYPQQVELGSHVDVAAMAEDEAVKERQRLGLGDQPVIHLRSLLEAEVGLRIIYEDLPSRIAGMFAFSRDFGGVIAVNRKHPSERRRATLVHEYGHLMTDRFKPGIDYIAYPGRKPVNERFAEAFSMAFLMPATSIRRRFNQIVNDRKDFNISDLCRLAHLYFVSVEAMANRLEALSLIPKGVREYLTASRFEVRGSDELLALQQNPLAEERFPDRYLFLAVHAFDRGELSEGELAAILRCDRVSAREIVEKRLSTAGDVSDDGQARLMDFESHSNESLLKTLV